MQYIVSLQNKSFSVIWKSDGPNMISIGYEGEDKNLNIETKAKKKV